MKEKEVIKLIFDGKIVYVYWMVVITIMTIVFDSLLAKTAYAEFQQETWLALVFTIVLATAVTIGAYKIITYLYKSS